MLLFTLLENRLLDRDRGDVIIFNNTSAEHPDTYQFVRNCMQTASHYGIPFFQIEFQTYEDARRGEWTRLPTYRMVKDMPISAADVDGFHWKGEVFEELLSWTGYVPNQFKRVCTRHLKLEVTRNFLKDWLASKPTIPRLGHYGNESRIDPEIAFHRHRENHGQVPRDIFLRKKNYVWNRPHVRPEQRYEDFCPDWKPFENGVLKGRMFGDRARFGKGGVEYVAFVGLRGDEPRRIQRVEDRSESAEGYEGEHVYMPLYDMAVTRDDVNAFWDRQEWDLSLPKEMGLSNCVYCFLKGTANLGKIHMQMRNKKQATAAGFGSFAGTPCDLAWWRRMESEYSRDLVAEERSIRSNATRVGFFGSNNFSYDDLEVNADLGEFSGAMLPCDCTE